MFPLHPPPADPRLRLPEAPPGEVISRLLFSFTNLIVFQSRRVDDAVTCSDAYHQIRSSAKRVRALLKLTSSVVPGSERKHLALSVSHLKDSVAHARDRDVLIFRLQELCGEHSPAAAPRRALHAGGKVIQPLARELEAGVASLQLQILRRRDVLREIAISYARAWAMFLACQKNSHDHRLHEWRKHVKTLQFQCVAFAQIDPLAVTGFRAAVLARLLGDHHDFAVMEGYLKKRGKRRKKHLKKIAKRKAALTKSAFKAGRFLFCLTPREFAAGLAKRG
ncbi:MAG: CHAD domain-containing protein [Terrimicrobiaceae bacterium]